MHAYLKWLKIPKSEKYHKMCVSSQILVRGSICTHLNLHYISLLAYESVKMHRAVLSEFSQVLSYFACY